MQIIRSDRITIRPIQPQEADILLDLLSVPDIANEFQNMAPLDRSGLFEEITKRVNGTNKLSQWLWIENQSTSDIEGFILISHYPVAPRASQIFYALRPSGRGKAFATEAVGLVLAYLQTVEGVPIVFLRGKAENCASVSVAQRAGFAVLYKNATFWGYNSADKEFGKNDFISVLNLINPRPDIRPFPTFSKTGGTFFMS